MKTFFTSFLLLFTLELQANNVILFIADGLGSAGITLARHEKRIHQDKPLTLDSIKQTALIKTSSFDNIVTDSAASATAISCGKKTKNRMIGMAPDETPLECITQLAKEMGKSVGIITTTSVLDATPSAFYAHSPDRSNSGQIAKQLLTTPIDLVLGGGAKELINLKYRQPNDYQHFDDFNKLRGRNIHRPILGTFAAQHFSFLKNRPADSKEPTLEDMTDFAIRHLAKNSKGFFLIVESGLIDYAAHQNKIEELIAEVFDYDNAIANAIEQISSNPKLRDETLLIALSDHETAGLSINGYGPINQSPLTQSMKFTGVEYDMVTFTTGPNSKHPTRIAMHSGSDVPAYAYGKNASKVSGTLENSDIFSIMLDELKRPDNK